MRTHLLSPRSTLGLLVLALGACAVPASESSDRAAQDLWVATSSGTQAWNRTIPICFAQSSLLLNDHTREKNIIQNAITRTWLHAANIPATWTNACPTTGGGQHLRIQLGLHTSYDGQTDGQTSPEGMSTLSADGPEDPNLQNPGIRLWIQDDGHSGQSQMEYMAVHEFGHALGFEHEQYRPDAVGCPTLDPNRPATQETGISYGPFDPDSIMDSYCGAADWGHAYLSAEDRAGVRAIYGWNADFDNFAADVNGDGKADALVVNSDAIYVMTSTGSTFHWSGPWTTSYFYGYRETLFGDVNGDRKADAIAIDESGPYVELSDGTKFNWNGQWSAPFYGTYKTIAADVNGDHKADLIAVGPNAITVETSDGTKFNAQSQWAGASTFGARGTWAGDVDGDGRADLVAMDMAGWRGYLSTGSAFAFSHSGSFTSNSRATAIADFNGDGLADLVSVNDWGVVVSLSSRTFHVSGFSGYWTWDGFGPPATYPAFYGDRTTLLGDFDGGGKTDVLSVNVAGQKVELSNGSGLSAATTWSASFLSQPYP